MPYIDKNRFDNIATAVENLHHELGDLTTICSLRADLSNRTNSTLGGKVSLTVNNDHSYVVPTPVVIEALDHVIESRIQFWEKQGIRVVALTVTETPEAMLRRINEAPARGVHEAGG